MAQQSELMAVGFSAPEARAVGTVYNGTLAAGSASQGGAKALADVSCGAFATASAGGFLLAPSAGKPICAYHNGSGNTQTLYPTGTETVNGTTSFAVGDTKSVILVPGTLGWVAILSA